MSLSRCTPVSLALAIAATLTASPAAGVAEAPYTERAVSTAADEATAVLSSLFNDNTIAWYENTTPPNGIATLSQ